MVILTQKNKQNLSNLKNKVKVKFAFSTHTLENF